MSKALYRKYRPCCLNEVVGQEQVTKVLDSSLKTGKINHAYLFVGPRGCGKTSVARILAHEINGFKYELEDDYVDIVEIDGASNRGIDNIRELREKVLVAPTRGKYKVYIIDEVHMLTKEAFNALLKTLEEPPAHVVFIMATTDAYKVPVTITSRAQTYTFRLADSDTMFNYLKSIAEKEKILIEDDALKIISKRGGGSFRDSLSLLDQISTLSDQTITKDMVISAMGLPQDEEIQALIDAYVYGDNTKIMSQIKTLLSAGTKPETIVEELISKIVDDPRPNLLSLLAKLPDVKAPFAEAKLLVAMYNTSTNNLPQPVIKQTPPKLVPTTTITFDWDQFTEKVRNLNEAIYAQLTKTRHEVSGDTLNIFPEKKIVKTILTRDNNKKILSEAAGGSVKITIHDVNDAPNDSKSDAVIDKISAIMGGKVQNDGGGNPF